MHCDTILKLMEDRANLNIYENPFSIDIKKLIKADSLAQFFAMYIDLKSEDDPFQKFLDMADKFYEELDLNSDTIKIAKNYDDIVENNKKGLISAVLTIEEGGALKGSIENLERAYDIGVRLITLTWNYPNEIGYPNCIDQYRNLGLTEFGREMILEMNKLGIIIDVSHLSDGGFYDVLELSQKPFVASHSNSRTVKRHTRNLSDDMIRRLSEKGGLIGINFEKHFLGNNNISKIDDMVMHIKHIKNIGGIEVIGIGSDFDGISKPLEIENIGQIGRLIDALRVNKFSEDELEKVFYKNALRVIKDVL